MIALTVPLALGVALAGGIGAALRFAVDSFVNSRTRLTVPLGTIVINVSGSLLLGLLTSLALHHAGLAGWRLLLGTGLLGGYTTFSTASVEAVRLVLLGGTRASWLALAHALGMLIAAVLAAALGFVLGAL